MNFLMRTPPRAYEVTATGATMRVRVDHPDRSWSYTRVPLPVGTLLTATGRYPEGGDTCWRWFAAYGGQEGELHPCEFYSGTPLSPVFEQRPHTP